MENNRDYDLSWYKLDHLKQKDKVLLDTVKDEYREIIERAQSRLPGSYVDLEWITSELKIDLEYPDNMISDVYGSISANGKGGYRIEIRKSDSPTRQRFTLAHELAHYLLHIDPKYPDLSVVAATPLGPMRIYFWSPINIPDPRNGRQTPSPPTF